MPTSWDTGYFCPRTAECGWRASTITPDTVECPGCGEPILRVRAVALAEPTRFQELKER